MHCSPLPIELLDEEVELLVLPLDEVDVVAELLLVLVEVLVLLDEVLVATLLDVDVLLLVADDVLPLRDGSTPESKPSLP